MNNEKIVTKNILNIKGNKSFAKKINIYNDNKDTTEESVSDSTKAMTTKNSAFVKQPQIYSGAFSKNKRLATILLNANITKDSQIPKTIPALMKIKGIGESTAKFILKTVKG